MQEKKFSIFTKILLISIVIFIGLTLYAYKMINDEKHNNHNNTTVSVKNTPIPHPPLTQRNKEQVAKNEIVNYEVNSSSKNNKIRNIPEGAEYISPEEQLKREEASLDDIPKEEIYNDSQIIPHNEINNYEDAITTPSNSFDNPSLGTPINSQNNQQHPTLGTPIGDTPISPF